MREKPIGISVPKTIESQVQAEESSRIYFLPDPENEDIDDYDDDFESLENILLDEYAVRVKVEKWANDYIWQLNCSPEEAVEIMELLEERGFWTVLQTERRVRLSPGLMMLNNEVV